MSVSVWCNPNVAKPPISNELGMALLYLHVSVFLYLCRLCWRNSSSGVGGRPRKCALVEAKGRDPRGQPCLLLVE